MKPVVITVGGSELTTWIECNLERKKEDLTGTLSVIIFGGSVPPAPIVREAQAGAEIQVYVGGQLAFTGSVDRREGKAEKKADHKMDKGTGIKAYPGREKHPAGSTEGHGHEISLGPTEYTIHLSARGKTKRLIDSSHQHPTTNMMQPTTKEAVEKLIEPWKTQLEWKAETIKLDKMRFRDGNRVVDELNRIGREKTPTSCTRPVTANSGSPTVWVPSLARAAIRLFSDRTSSPSQRSSRKMKRNRKSKSKASAPKSTSGVKRRSKKPSRKSKNSSVKDFVPYTVQHYGDADDKTLERRARFEANQRANSTKKVTIEVFHVQSPSGSPWDIGDTHYVEIPPEGIYDVFECIELTYRVKYDKELKTTLVLSPPPSGGAGGSSGGFGLSGINSAMGAARRSQAGISIVDGQYPAPWTGPQLSELPLMTLAEAAAQPPKDEADEPRKPEPPLVLPPWFGDA